MPQTNRNDSRDRKRGEPRRYESEEERRYPQRHEDQMRGMSRLTASRTDQMSSQRENDLYERQSI